MSLITKECIQEITARLDAISLVNEYVRLDKKGGRYWGRCPFHSGGQEKTPSFTVDPDKKMYHCFGCGKGGGVIGFIMEMDKLTYPEALKILARKVGVSLVYEDAGFQPDVREDDQREELIELYTRTAGTFHYFLTGKPAKNSAYDYIVARGISEEMIERFNLGYAPSDRNWLYQFLTQKGYSPDFLDKSGLFSTNYRGLAFFSDRLMFPIVDRQGRTVAFGGRAMPGAVYSDGKEPPRYLNSRDSDIFKKGQTLFAINLAMDEIRRSKTVYIAEGYMDVIALHQAGLSNAVAPLGTAFTDDQAKLLRRWADRAILVFDRDKAGQDAAYKGILTCRKNGLSCSLIDDSARAGDAKGENGEKNEKMKDPADFLQKFGGEALKKSMKCFITDLDYLIFRGRDLYNVSTPGGKRAALTFLFPYLELLDSEIERNDCITAAADAFGADRDAARQDFDQWLSSGGSKGSNSSAPVQEQATESGEPLRMNTELSMLIAVAANQVLYPELRRELEIKEIEDPSAREIFVALEECFANDDFGIDALLDRIKSEKVRDFVARRGTSPEFQEDKSSGRDPEKLVKDGINQIKEKRLRRRVTEIMAEMREGERRPETMSADRLDELIAEKMRIDSEIRRLEGR